MLKTKGAIQEGTYGAGKVENKFFFYWTNTNANEEEAVPEICIKKNDGLNGYTTGSRSKVSKEITQCFEALSDSGGNSEEIESLKRDLLGCIKKGGEEMKSIKVIMNEQHNMNPEQEAKLRNIFSIYEPGHNPEDVYEDICISKGYDIVTVPADGWTLGQMNEVIRDLEDADTVIFVSPVPYLLAKMSAYGAVSGGDVRLFHNDQRSKKELPNGKIISVTAQTGWQLIKVV